MTRRNIAGVAKNAMGTVFLLAGAFFVCSTFVSMRAVFADPIAPVVSPTVSNAASPRANATSRASNRSNAASRVRTTNASATTSASRANASQRGVVARTTTTSTASRANAPQRGVVSRGGGRTSVGRNVVARTSTSPSRVSLSGNAIQGNKGAAAATQYTYLSGKLYTGNYSNIIDSTTGLISAEAYQNCLDSYYTCMDEICTARSAAQGRCACAARVKSFIQAEDALETANEELIKASGELALLIANKGKDVSQAFQLTDAEKVMNCVSWQETVQKYGQSSDEAVKWCTDHNIFANNGGSVSQCAKPSYCSAGGNTFGFDIANIEGSSSDILATLQSWADSKADTVKLLESNNENLLNAFTNVSNIVSGLTSSLDSSDKTLDSLANTWGYELFQYAHNNVCGRVLDTCFNGIYEACGTPPTVRVNNSTGGSTTASLCANGATSNCPFNYNSKVAISSTGDVTLNERGSTNATTSSSATCFGYNTSTTTNGTTTTSDPYATLRGPVADARRSVMQKYLLDTNAACDVYGDMLKATAQKIGYQKIAAQQALQQKRLEFASEEEETILADATNAITNFTECVDEIYDCYETMLSSHGPKSSVPWTVARIRTYCAQMSQVPNCYEDMICNPSYAQFKAVIDDADSLTCSYTQDYKNNTCRNVITLNEILNGAATKSATAAVATAIATNGITSVKDSAALRELCLQEALGSTASDYDPSGVAVRTWLKNRYEELKCDEKASVGSNGLCVCGAGFGGDGYTCKACDTNATSVNGTCTCKSGFTGDGYTCTQTVPAGGSEGTGNEPLNP